MGTDDFLWNVLISHRIVEMLYHSKNNGGCGFLLSAFSFDRVVERSHCSNNSGKVKGFPCLLVPC